MASSIIAVIPGLGDAAGSIIKGAGLCIKCEQTLKVGKAVSTTCRMIGAVAQTSVNMVNFDKAFRSVRKEYRETGHVSFLNGANAALSALGVVGGVAYSVSSAKSFNKMRGVKSVGSCKSKLDYVTSNGAKLEATLGKTTTILGTYKSDTGAILDELGNGKSLDFGARDGGFNLLNTPDELYISPEQFWIEYNKPWLDNVIERDDIIKIATEPTWENLTRVNKVTGKIELTGFGREFTYLRKCGYKYNAVTKTMMR